MSWSPFGTKEALDIPTIAMDENMATPIHIVSSEFVTGRLPIVKTSSATRDIDNMGIIVVYLGVESQFCVQDGYM